MVLPDSHGISRAPCYLGYHSRVKQISITGLSPCVAVLSRTFIYLIDFLLFEVVSATSEWSHNPITATSENYHADMVWPLPLSLANTNGIIFIFSSCGYWDVSLPHVPSSCPMCSGRSDWTLLQPGFPIRKSSNQSSIGSSSRLIAALYVLHRLLMPRHPPCALINLALAEIIFITRCSRPLCSSQITGRNQNRLELFIHRVNSG